MAIHGPSKYRNGRGAGCGAGGDDDAESARARRRAGGQRKRAGGDAAGDRGGGTSRGDENLLALDLVVRVPVGRGRTDEAVPIEVGVGDREQRAAVQLGTRQRIAGDAGPLPSERIPWTVIVLPLAVAVPPTVTPGAAATPACGAGMAPPA